MQGQNDFSSYCRWMHERNKYSQWAFCQIHNIFRDQERLLFTKQNGVLSYICRGIFGSDVTPELQDTVKRLVFKIFSSVMCDITTRCQALGVFGKLSETSDFVNFACKYLGKWGDFSIEISALFCICSTLIRWGKVVLALHFNFNGKYQDHLSDSWLG